MATCSTPAPPGSPPPPSRVKHGQGLPRRAFSPDHTRERLRAPLILGKPPARPHPAMKHFLGALCGALCLAYAFPALGVKGGPVRPEFFIKQVGVAVIFFGSGLSLPTAQLGSALKKWRVSVAVQTFHFVVCPLLFTAAARFFMRVGLLSPMLSSGLSVLGCLPPPISSAVILTTVAGGNPAVAILNSCFGSLLGILLTPPLTVVVSGAQAEVGVGQLLVKLGSTVVVPLVCGQLARKLGVPKTPKWLGKGILIAIIWHAFSETFSHPVPVGLFDVASVVVCIAGIQVLLVVLAGNAAIWTQQPRPDVVALGFTCSHKSLTLGMPILMALYGGSNNFILYSLPLLVYHPMQIILGSVLFGPIFKVYVNAGVVHAGTGGDGVQLKTMSSSVASVGKAIIDRGGAEQKKIGSFFARLAPSRQDRDKDKVTRPELLV